MTKTLQFTVEVEAPDDATHYTGKAHEASTLTFYKVTHVGAAGEHWWCWSDVNKEWIFQSHRKPHWVKEIP